MSKRDAFDDADGDVWLARERAGGALLARDRRIRGGEEARERRERTKLEGYAQKRES